MGGTDKSLCIIHNTSHLGETAIQGVLHLTLTKYKTTIY